MLELEELMRGAPVASVASVVSVAPVTSVASVAPVATERRSCRSLGVLWGVVTLGRDLSRTVVCRREDDA